MNTISSTEAKKHFYSLISKINTESRPVLVTNKKSGNIVMISESDWNAIQGILYLESIPSYMESVKEAEKDEQDLYEMETLNLQEEW